MNRLSLLNYWPSPTARTRRRRSPLQVQTLEDRAVPATWYVNAMATGANNGQDWADADTSLQAALGSAAAGDQIWVAQGTYKPTDTADRTISFVLKEGVAVYGGFAGGEGNLLERNWAAHPTVLSGDIGIAGNPSDNSYHVLTSTGLTNATVLDGFTVMAGNANGSGATTYGGGMANNSSSPTLTNLTFTANSAYSGGGGMDNYDHSSPVLTNVAFNSNSTANAGGGMYNNSYSSPTLTNVTFTSDTARYGGGMDNSSYSSPVLTNVAFTGNTATQDGGGLDNFDHSTPVLTNVTFTRNNAARNGGGMANSSSSPILANVTFTTNLANSNGGGMDNLNSSAPTLANVTFIANTAGNGGGMHNDSSSPVLSGAAFTGNSAATNGGGMYNSNFSAPAVTNVTFTANIAGYGGGMRNEHQSSPTLTNVSFTGNLASGDGGGLDNFDSSSPIVTNVTFAGNSAANGGGMANVNSSPTLINCILWGDASGEIYNAGSSPVVSYSDVQGPDVYPGEGNINVDPMFVNATTGDLHLRPGSPAIDAGTDIGAPSTDLDGVSRPIDGNGDGVAVVDMGAYETQVNVAPTLSGGAELYPILQGTTNPPGRQVAALFAGLVADPDAGSSLAGLAVVGNPQNGEQGTWQYSTDAGTSWFDVGPVADGANALALSATTLIRFLPQPWFSGSPDPLTVRALDNTFTALFTDGATRATVGSATNGRDTPVSGNTAGIRTDVFPTSVGGSWLSPDGNLIVEGTTANDLIQVRLNSSRTVISVYLNRVRIGQYNTAGVTENIQVRGLNGNDTITVDGRITIPAVLEGGPGADRLTGGGGNDWLYGFTAAAPNDPSDGNDVINGGSGNDRIFAGAGNDTANGGAGDDSIEGGAGSDRLYGSAGNDTIYGFTAAAPDDPSDGNDLISGGAGNDLLFGGAGNDTVSGGYGNDSLVGGAGNDNLSGSYGNDTLSGGDGTDTANGGSGTDTGLTLSNEKMFSLES